MSVNPSDKIINNVFGNTRYYIDFYQRDYKWKSEHVESLLDDIFYKFENEYRADLDVTAEIISRFGWYYLNTYVTNKHDGKIFIVDGQQRFTTLSLILLKLYHLASKFALEERKDWIKSKIFGFGPEGNSFWMGADNREQVLEDLFKNDYEKKDLAGNNISIVNMYQNYSYLSNYLNKKLDTRHKIDAFVLFFLTRLVLVEIFIEDSEDVSMVFEVINDRGEKLKPYEVFKGELLGQLDKTEIESTYYNIWTSNISNLQLINEREIDNFFRFYFRAKFVDTSTDYRDFDGDYHKAVFSNKWNPIFKLKRNPQVVKAFLKNEFDYYAKIYARLLRDTEKEDTYLFYNSLNEQDRQYLLILSSLNVNDKDEQEKISLVSQLFDRHYTVLQLFRCYDSNKFTEIIINLNKNIRGKSLDEIKKTFQDQLVNDISTAKSINITDPFNWILFRDTNINLSTRFIRYFYARIEKFVAKEAKLQSDNYNNLVKNTGYVNGYHIEHILSNNSENRSIFNNDEDLFYRERNRLGAILLLKGKDNTASGNEPYSEKLKIYSRATVWAQTLTSNFYHKNPDFNDFVKRYQLDFKPLQTFDQSATDYRQKLLFDIVKIIWS